MLSYELMTSAGTFWAHNARVSVRKVVVFLLHGCAGVSTGQCCDWLGPGLKSPMKYWYEFARGLLCPLMLYGPNTSSWTPYLPKESSIQYRFIVWKWFSACGLLRKSR